MENKETEAILLVREAIAEARAKHGPSIESPVVTDDRRLRIMVEEVGECARAIEDIEVAAAQLMKGSATAERQEAFDLAIDNLRDELAQVAACAVRWLSFMLPE
jgi:NTP pyrophosphatase (non-canonical NTP hydrolase)